MTTPALSEAELEVAAAVATSPLCLICEENRAVAGDGRPVCMQCVYRFSDMAHRPELLSYELAKNLSAVHGDLVSLVTEADGELFITPSGQTFFRPTGETRLVWKFDEEAFVPGRRPPYAAVDEAEWVHQSLRPYPDGPLDQFMAKEFAKITDEDRERIERAYVLLHPTPYPECVAEGCEFHPYVM